MIKKDKIKKILLITLSNIGDVVLTFPVIDILKKDFPDALLSVVVGPKGEALFKDNFHIENVCVFDKKQSFLKTFKWILKLRKRKFDLVIDLRNTAIPFFLGARTVTPPFMKRLKNEHMQKQHLSRLRSVYSYDKKAETRFSLKISSEDEAQMKEILRKKLDKKEKFILLSAGAADSAKRWTEDGFAFACDRLMDKYSLKAIFVGDHADRVLTQRIIKKMHNSPLNCCGMTTLTQLAFLIQESLLLITNDSAPMHMASYFDIPVLALFGPTDPMRYGPWSKNSYVLASNEHCLKCKNKKSAAIHAYIKKGLPHRTDNDVGESPHTRFGLWQSGYR